MKDNITLDASRLARPLAAVRVRQALDAMCSGELIRVQSVPSGLAEDMEYYAGRAGHEIVLVDEEGGRTDIVIKKG